MNIHKYAIYAAFLYLETLGNLKNMSFLHLCSVQALDSSISVTRTVPECPVSYWLYFNFINIPDLRSNSKLRIAERLSSENNVFLLFVYWSVHH